MSLLPRRLVQSANNKLVLVFLFIAIFISLFATPALAQEPNPLPCQNPIVPGEKILTHNWLVDEDRQPPANLQISATATGPPGASVIARTSVEFTVDFSKMGALFGPSNSNYNEGNFQSRDHKSENIQALEGEDFNAFNGAVIKLMDDSIINQYRVKTVEYIYSKPALGEAGDIYTDDKGENPTTIHKLVTQYGIPNPNNQESDDWQNGWRKYWSKIPTSYSEFYEAYIRFREESNNFWISQVLAKEYCPDWLDRIITFVMPEYFRSTATAGHLNMNLTPWAAQSHHSNDLVLGNKDEAFLNEVRSSRGVIGKIIDTCLKAFKNNPVSRSLHKVISFTVDVLTPVKTANAQSNRTGDPNDCIRITVNEKVGNDSPYCALVNPEAQGATCTDKFGDPLKVNQGNPNVICTFTIEWSKSMVLSAGNDEIQFDVCRPNPNGTVTCTVAVWIWPLFLIPWQTELWNGTTYSDIPENEPFLGSPQDQVENRPGFHDLWTPKAIRDYVDPENQAKADALQALLDECEREVALNPPENPFDRNEWPDACNGMVALAGDANTTDYPQYFECIWRNGGPQPYTWYISCAYEFFQEVIESLLLKRAGVNDNTSTENLTRRISGGNKCTLDLGRFGSFLPEGVQKQFGISNTEGCPEIPLVASFPNTGIDPPSGTQIISCNNIGDSVSATLIKQHLDGLIEADPAMDVDGNGEITDRDWEIVLLCEAGLDPNEDLSAPPSSGPPPDYIAPNNDNCGGFYSLSNPLGNFGDPNCDLPSITDIRNEFARLDPANIDIWMCLVRVESSHSPNAWNPDAPDPAGAWGLLQMGRGRNGQFDHGDVPWKMQIYNAINYNWLLGGDFVGSDGAYYWQPNNPNATTPDRYCPVS